jgi:1-acyl-sn-glycerol-3-phosphate acyltransferase
MLSKIRTLLSAAGFVLTMIAVVFLMFFDRKHNRAIRKGWSNLQKYLVGFRMNIKGEPDQEAKLLVINHQSMLDIVAIEAIYPQNIAWVAKKEIADVFFLGQTVKLSKMILIDRSDKRAMVKLLRDAKDRLNNNRPIAIFPEGTRGRGDKLLKFQIGAKMLAEKLDLRVQPIVIANARNVFDTQSFKINGGEIDISYLPSVETKNDEKWFEHLHEAMQKELSLLLENRQR